MDVTPGSRLGPYEIVSRLGAGGMGEVFRAKDTRLDRSVAIKVLPEELARNSQFKVRFEREAKAISQLNHPNICTLYDVGDDYLVMELLEGETLAERVAKGPLPLGDVLKFGAQIADALDRAHRAGIVHRDLKPANVMITKSGAKLLDFGLAKSGGLTVDPHGETVHHDQSLTQEGTILGTFQYMAPEQLEAEEADARTDIFALGAVLYEMATGVRAFDGSTKTSLIAAIVSQDPKPLAQIVPLTPPAFEHLVSRCLAKSPDDRWQSAHDIAEQLRWISEAGSQAGAAAPAVTRSKSRDGLTWMLAALFVAALATAGWFATRAARASSTSVVWDLAPPDGLRFNAVGDDSGAAVLSPDGTMVVFAASDSTKIQLWLRVIATGEVRALPGTINGAYPFWSPDNKSIAFFSTGALKRIDVLGGAPVLLTHVPTGRGGTWSKDGTIVFTPDTQEKLWRIPAGGGAPVPASELVIGKQTSHRWPWFLPDGKHFLYLAANHQSPVGGDNAIYVGSLDGAPPRLVMQSVTNMIVAGGYALFNRDDTVMAQPISSDGVLSGEPQAVATNVLHDAGIWRGALSASETGVLMYHRGRAQVLSSLRWVDRAGKELELVGEPGSYWDLELSADTQKVAISVGDPQREVWIRDLARKTFARFPIVGSFTGTAAFSPDGATVYFDVTRNGKSAVYSRRVTGGGETTVAELEEFPLAGAVSPDGKEMLVHDRRGRISRIPLHPPGKAVMLTQPPGNELYPVYSPDGRWIAYQAEENGRYEAFVMSATDPTQKWKISPAGGVYPRFRRDGKEMFYLDSASRLTAVAIDITGTDLVLGATTILFPLTPRPQARAYDVSPDGQRFLVNTINELQSPMAVVVSNWKSRLKK
jgi:Tol biopolymer transport system component/predicted Ser/Thr protein kinase